MKNFAKIVVVMAILLTIIFALKYAPDFEKTEITDRTNLVINYTNVTSKMKNKVYVENDIIYLSMEDIKNYYDKYIFYDKTYNRIISTYRDNIAYIPLQNGSTSINDVKMVNAHAITLNEKIYIPISKLEELYNIKTTYIKDKNIIILESLEREFKTAKASKKISVKYKSSHISRTVDKIYSNEKLTIIPADNDLKGWVKVRTKNGKIGYVEEKNLTEIKIEKEQEKITRQVEGNISLVWEYFSEYSHAPERGQVKLEGVNVVSPAFFYLKDGLLKENVGTYGEQYIQWAKNNNYKIWPMVANNTDSAEKKEAFSKIMNDSKLRLELINSIVSYVEKYDLDGINLDFENMYQKDKDVFSRFVIELAPRLKTKNAVFSVDVTAPDGSPDWSLCFNRNVIGNVADYIVFMAYDQNGVSSKTPGTVAGYDWVEKSIKKFLEQEEVVAEKIILGIPFLYKVMERKFSRIIKFSSKYEKSRKKYS